MALPAGRLWNDTCALAQATYPQLSPPDGFQYAGASCSRRSSTSISVGVGSVENMTEVLFPDSISGDSIKCVRHNLIEPNHAMLYQISTCYHIHYRILCFNSVRSSVVTAKSEQFSGLKPLFVPVSLPVGILHRSRMYISGIRISEIKNFQSKSKAGRMGAVVESCKNVHRC